MSKYVLDAHALIWYVEGNARLGSQAKAVLSDPVSRLFVPAIALAEACRIVAAGRTKITSYGEVLRALGADPRFAVVPLDREIVEQSMALATVLEMHDRQIAATTLALTSGGDTVFLLTRDAGITRSGVVPIVW